MTEPGHSAILALNAGSSSVKFALFDEFAPDTLPVPLLRGSLTDEGGNGDARAHRFRTTDGDGAIVADERWSCDSVEAAMDRLIDWIEGRLDGVELAGVGHRVVHGGRGFADPVRVDDAVLEGLEALTPLAPLHQPVSLIPIRHLRKSRPALAQFACFDTAFHHGLTPPVSRYPLPRTLEDEGVRRYGFHGLSYEAIASKLASLDDDAVNQKVVVAHLGSGASLCAMLKLKSVDTTMGFTALDGIMMGTRPGTIDPGILLYLMRTKGYGADRIERMLYHESGLLGVSGLSSDVETLLASNEPEADEALDLFAFTVARQAAALAATMGGLDRFVFTGGVGENAVRVREMVVGRLSWLGAELSPALNDAGAPLVSTRGSRVLIDVIETDEEAVICHHVANLLRTASRK